MWLELYFIISHMMATYALNYQRKTTPPIKGASEFYERLMDKKPETRLTMKEIEEIVKTWIYSPNEPSEEIKGKIKKAEETYSTTNISNSYPKHMLYVSFFQSMAILEFCLYVFYWYILT